ncbi:MAG: NUDIX domain-containing protein [Planctomycetota bacterium]
MKQVKSCGFLIFREHPEKSFLLLKNSNRWDLPKGHLDEGETELDCAFRELSEETGIPRELIEIDKDFYFSETYYPRYRRFGGEIVEKTVILFLARLRAETSIQVTEHLGYAWLPWKPPYSFQEKTIQALLQKVHTHWKN